MHKQSPIKEDSTGDEIQGGVDFILGFVIAFGKSTPIPFLSLAAESVQKISETVKVCATMIDLRSQLLLINRIIRLLKTIKRHWKIWRMKLKALSPSYGALITNLTIRKIGLLKSWETYWKIWLGMFWVPFGHSKQTSQHGWISILQDICRFVDDNLSRGLISRIWHSKMDPAKLQKYKKALDASLERFKVGIFIR